MTNQDRLASASSRLTRGSTLISMNAAPHILTPGSTVEILKGLRHVWMGKRYEDVRVRERWTVESAVRDEDYGLTVVLVRGGLRLRMYAAQATRTAQPEFSLNTGDPTKSIRVLVTRRAPIVAEVAT